MCTLGIGAIDIQHPVVEFVRDCHGTLDAIRNTVNVPSHDPIHGMLDEYRRGEHIRGTIDSKTGRGKDRQPDRYLV